MQTFSLPLPLPLLLPLSLSLPLLLPLSLSLPLLLTACAAPAPAKTADAQAADAAKTVDSAAETAGACGPLDDELRVHHLQMLGTHNSYHVAKPNPLSKEWAYSHDPLPVQLDQQGVRSFEFDVHYKGVGQPIAVRHVQALDDGSLCATLGDCLQTLKQWSDAHPCHHPLLVTLENKDELEELDVADHLDDLEAQILAVWPKERLIRPDDVRGSYATLGEAVQAKAWPTLKYARGKLLVISYDKEDLFAKYKKLRPGLQGAAIFVFGSIGDPDTGAILADNPSDPTLTTAANLGYLVRTFPDPTAADSKLALGSGAHIVSTDYPVERARKPGFVLQLPGGLPSRCNPLTAPKNCTAEAVNAGVGTSKP